MPALYYFPTSAPKKIIKISAANPPRLVGFLIREATTQELADIAEGKTYWTPSANGGQLSAPPAAKWKVSKDTIIQRITAAGKVADAAALYAAQSDADKFVWDGSSWFWSDNSTLIGLASGIGLDASDLLAKDPDLY